jgi:hypothetical protein
VETWSSGRSLLATALAISVMEAGSFSGGEFCHLSNGLSSSQGLSGTGISMAGVVGRKLGEAKGFFARSVTFRRLLALASQLAICDGFNSLLLSSSAFCFSVGYGLSECASSHSLKIFTACRGNRIPLRFELPGASSTLTEVLAPALDLRGLMPVRVPCSFATSSSTICKVSRRWPVAEFKPSRVLVFVRLHSRNNALHGVQAVSPLVM